MDYYSCIQKSLDFIEDNLIKDIALKEVAEAGGFSLYHFQRIFKALTGDSLREYIRKRRLTEASFELLYTNTRVIEIAMKYHFGSQESFTRAFKKVYNKTPGKYRKENKNITYYHRNIINVDNMKHITQNIEVVYHSIIEKEIMVVGVEYTEQYNIITFNKMLKDFISRKDLIKNVVDPNMITGICYSDVSDFYPEKQVNYMFCTEVRDFKDIPKGMIGKLLPRRDYLVFIHKASREKMDDTFNYIYGSFLPKSGYELLEGDDLIIFDYKNDNESRLYIPIKT
ncbi:AraC family transcriptional regulator [Oceanirhabdus sp. W0125-5]|uniref:AraC family transcriptional regulator n=1 Tax=Oceanirhabdus sp. W0125-5 TaxID=2999116 RepID=UPI0022F2D226|nr:AraC family transcriptional regulator [Oceanirhabdus sp. W0125-5]WBW95615.1 AraC family transcriptional regulator [Oceanirhabdus sp. W0125-5]